MCNLKFSFFFVKKKKKKNPQPEPTWAMTKLHLQHGLKPIQFTQFLHTRRLNSQGGMRVVQSRQLTPPNLRFCHSFHPISLNPTVLLLLPPTQYPSLKNSIPIPPIPHKPTSSFSFGSLIRASMASSTTPSTGTEAETKPFSVLFVCLGNICRSPAAEGVFTDLVKKRGLDSSFKIDSAGTIDYHEVRIIQYCLFTEKTEER